MPVRFVLFKWLHKCWGVESKLVNQNSILTSIERIHAIPRKCLSRGRKNRNRKVLLVEMAWGAISQHLVHPAHFTVDRFANKSYRILSHLLVVAEVQAATPMILYNFVSPMNKDWYGSRRIKLEERDRSKYPVSVVQCSCAIKGNPIFSSLLLHSDFPHNKKLSNSQCLPNQKHGNNSFSENL